MIELKRELHPVGGHLDRLIFSFPELHADAVLTVRFQRTLRVPDDGRKYPLPPGLGSFPLRHVDDHGERVPEAWRRHGGVMLPMHPAEALWIRFNAAYPFAVKVGAGKINAITGKRWDAGRLAGGRAQNFLTVPGQSFLDGFAGGKAVTLQFVAMPLGNGHTVEEQITGDAEYGGLQLQVFPLRREKWEEIKRAETDLMEVLAPGPRIHNMLRYESESYEPEVPAMGLGKGGQVEQKVRKHTWRLVDYATHHTSRCFVHLADARAWKAITGEEPPPEPTPVEAYTEAGLPWYAHNGSPHDAVEGSKALARLKTVKEVAEAKGDPLPGNSRVSPARVTTLAAWPDPGKARSEG